MWAMSDVGPTWNGKDVRDLSKEELIEAAKAACGFTRIAISHAETTDPNGPSSKTMLPDSHILMEAVNGEMARRIREHQQSQ